MDLSIILLTYQRTDYALRAIDGICENLMYGLFKPDWVVVDDGSDKSHIDAIRAKLDGHEFTHDLYSERVGYGALANKAMSMALSDVTLWLEDDWVLNRPLVLSPYIALLNENENIGMVRLGHLPIGLELSSEGYSGHMYLNVQKGTQYAYSGNPHLKHKRFYEQYGEMPTGKHPGDTEIAYDAQVRSRYGPRIVWPLQIGDRPYFDHIGEIKSYEP